MYPGCPISPVLYAKALVKQVFQLMSFLLPSQVDKMLQNGTWEGMVPSDFI
jgi:hypothetical protein